MKNINTHIGIAQTDPIVGNIEYNAKKVINYIKIAQEKDLDLIVFPQLTLIGYPLGDILERYPLIAGESLKYLRQIAKFTTKTVALVGFIDDKNYQEATAILKNGKIDTIINKQDCPKIIEINGIKYAIITEEVDKSDKFIADAIINIASTTQKLEKRYATLSEISKNNSTPLFHINQVGAVDGASFDGTSMVFNSNGELIAKAKSFEEQLLTVKPFNFDKIYPPITKQKQETFSLDYEDDLERTYNTIIQGIKDYFAKNGFKRAVLGLSGGLDSTVCAVLLADALGAENVFGVSMPSKITSQESKSDAEELAKNLGINFTTIPIKDMVNTATETMSELFSKVEENWNCRYEKSYTPDNIQARSRATILWAVSNEFESCLPIATSDKSEAYMGYATINGDMSGGFAPIGDITKTKLFALARYLNKNREVKDAIPESVILKRPGAELAIDPKTGKPLIAEDALMPYEFLDEVIWRIENKKEQYKDMINSEFLYEKKNPLTKKEKAKFLDKFYRRMAGATFKGTLMPPIINVDTKNQYHQPISAKINYKEQADDVIAKNIL